MATVLVEVYCIPEHDSPDYDIRQDIMDAVEAGRFEYLGVSKAEEGGGSNGGV